MRREDQEVVTRADDQSSAARLTPAADLRAFTALAIMGEHGAHRARRGPGAGATTRTSARGTEQSRSAGSISTPNSPCGCLPRRRTREVRPRLHTPSRSAMRAAPSHGFMAGAGVAR